MNNSACPKLEKCPIFINNVLHNEILDKTYRHLYCLAENEKYRTCRRYQVAEKYGKPAPDKILPNSTLSVEEIGRRMGVIQ